MTDLWTITVHLWPHIVIIATGVAIALHLGASHGRR